MSSSSSAQKTAQTPAIGIYSSSPTSFDPFTAYAPEIQMSVQASPSLCEAVHSMRVDILKSNRVVAVLHLFICPNILESCSTRDDLIQQDLDILPNDSDIRLANRRPFELACGKMPPVSYVGGRIRSQGTLYPYATFESKRSSMFRGQGNRVRHQLIILDHTRVAPVTAFILIIANQAYHRCVWSKHLNALAKRYDLTQYHKSQGMVFNPAGAAGG